MVQFAGVNKGYSAVAQAFNAVNLLNNGAFTAYDIALVPVEDVSLNRRDFELLYVPDVVEDQNTRLFDVLDSRLYRETRVLSFVAPLTAGSENKIGYWDIYGPASVDVMPTDSTGSVLTSRDGGNLVKIALSKAGAVFLDQPISELEPLFGRTVTLAFSGRKLTSSVKVTVLLIIDGSESIAIQSNSQLFGGYRRLVGEVGMPERFASLIVRIKLEGTGGSSLGLSGCSLVLGAQSKVPYTPSIPDLAVPSGVVFMVLGTSCPAGFAQPADMAGKLANVSGSAASLLNYVPSITASKAGPDIVTSAGNHSHDHSNAADAPIDALEPESTHIHQTASTVPKASKAFVHGVLFNDNIIATTHFFSEKPVKVLGVDHSHRLQSNMEAVPPSFGVRFCRKI